MTSRLGLIASLLLLACSTQEPPSRRIQHNDNLVAAGRGGGTTRTLALEVREGDWYPDADTAMTIPVLAFSEQGEGTPGPRADAAGHQGHGYSCHDRESFH